MPFIHLTTFIAAPIETVFDLSRSIDLHQTSLQHTNEKAIAGITTGLIKEGETVTWQAKHLLATRKMTVKITAMQSPIYFKDEMIAGDFKTMWHEHHFTSTNNGTTMKDVFYFESPFGLIGKLFNYVFLTHYMRTLLQKRNEVIQKVAEGQA
jgi:ligand-binding SRPBCC domain-containing protein